MKNIFTFALFFGIIISLVGAVDCPRGILNDPSPGFCGLYTDSNKNGICDLSQQTITQSSIAPISSTSVKPLKYIVDYNFLTISIISIILYIVSLVLSKNGKIRIVTQRKIWNVLLLVSFLGTGISGVLLVLKISYGLQIGTQFNWLFWHVETGIVMTLISVFHIIWHLPYFKTYLRG